MYSGCEAVRKLSDPLALGESVDSYYSPSCGCSSAYELICCVCLKVPYNIVTLSIEGCGLHTVLRDREGTAT